MITEPLRRYLVALARTYAHKTHRTLGAVSYQIYGHALFLDDFARGKRTVSLEKYDTMVVKLKKVWPPDEPWPELPRISYTAPPWISKTTTPSSS
jgi:hypothetical protein